MSSRRTENGVKGMEQHAPVIKSASSCIRGIDRDYECGFVSLFPSVFFMALDVQMKDSEGIMIFFQIVKSEARTGRWHAAPRLAVSFWLTSPPSDPF